MEINEYISKKKELNDIFLNFIDNSSDETDNFQDLIYHIENNQYLSKKDEFKLFLQIILHISNHHHRKNDFLRKIEQILQYYANHIKQTFTNFELFCIYKNNKRILLFLLSNQIMTLDRSIFNLIYNMNENKEYRHFLLPEIKPFISKIEYTNLLSELPTGFEEKRLLGENNSFICSLIRDDSIDEFVTYMNQTNTNVNKTIDPSIFETNAFLLNKSPTLIEYAAFFGSIQIFQYLRLNDAKLETSLWLFAIHSNNPELIHLLEQNNIHPDDDSREACFIESIKCHHNNIANYIQDNYSFSQSDCVVENCIRYHNYLYFPNYHDSNILFYSLCRYNLTPIVSILIEMDRNILEKEISN